jgi:hypothetical protein
VEVTTTRNLRSSWEWLIVHRADRLDRADATRLPPIALTSVARTLLDLGGMVAVPRVEAALDDALRRRLVSLPRLHACLQRVGGRGRRGAGVLRKLLADRGEEDVAESLFERRILKLLRSSGLPAPEPQWEIREGGRTLARIDLTYPLDLVAIEADGYRYHSGRNAWQHDLTRRNALTARGWRLFHVTWDDLTRRPESVVAAVAELLGSRPSNIGARIADSVASAPTN